MRRRSGGGYSERRVHKLAQCSKSGQQRPAPSLSGNDVRREMVNVFKVHVISTEMDVGMKYLARANIFNEASHEKYNIAEICLHDFARYGEAVAKRHDELVELMQTRMGASG